MTSLLFTVTFGLVIWSLTSRHADRIAALLIAVLLISAAGLRRDGYDFDNYLNLIDAVRSSSSMDVDFTYRLQSAKDPMFIWVTDLVTILNPDDHWPVFMAFAFIAVISKYIAVLSFPRYSALFMGIYLIFLSPTLEFSGIRSAAAIGILMMVVAYPMRWELKLPFLILSVATHVSLILSSLISLFTCNFDRSRRGLVVLTIIIAVAAYLFSNVLNNLDRGANYIDNKGTIFAPLFAVISSILFTIQIWASDKYKDDIYLNISFIFGLSLGLSLPSIAISHRILEIGQSLFLFVMVRDLATGIARRNRPKAVLVLTCFMGFEFLHHIYMGNWLAITIL